MDPVRPSYSLSSTAEFHQRLPPIFVPAVVDPVHYCLFMYANEWREKKPPQNTVLAVATTANHHSSGGLNSSSGD